MYASLALIPMPIPALTPLSTTVLTPTPDIIYGNYCIYVLNKATLQPVIRCLFRCLH